MTAKKQELYNVVENLPEELLGKAIDYIDYLTSNYIKKNTQEELIIKNNKDLLNKLKKGMKDTDEGKVCSIDEAFSEVSEILAN